MDQAQHDLNPSGQAASLTGTEFRELRRAAGYKQVAVASKAGVSASYISLIENELRPLTGEMQARLLKALRILPIEERRTRQLISLGSAVLNLVEEFTDEENDRVSA